MHHPPPQWQPPPQRPDAPTRFLQIGVPGAIVIILFAVGGTFLRIANEKTAKEIETTKTTLPAVGAEGTLAKAGNAAPLCSVPNAAGLWGYPCHGEKTTDVPPSSHVR